MTRKIILTQDGSHTITIPQLNVTYHSTFGAVQESKHIFIEAGLRPLLQIHHHIRILEVGFGTGLNALLSLASIENTGKTIMYTAIEPFPLTNEETDALNYCSHLQKPELQIYFQQLHSCSWEKYEPITNGFTIFKTMLPLQLCLPIDTQQIVFFDAFAPVAQPEIWTKETFDQLYRILEPNGILVTYCSKGEVRRTMKAAGFTIEKLPGPRGKREMIRAKKL